MRLQNPLKLKRVVAIAEAARVDEQERSTRSPPGRSSPAATASTAPRGPVVSVGGGAGGVADG